MKTLHRFIVLVGLLAAMTPGFGADDVDVYLSLEDAPKTVFPDAEEIERHDIAVDDALRERMKPLIGRLQPSMWEPFYITFVAKKGGKTLGYAVVCEEIGKHRPMTFIVAVDPSGHILDVALMMYREAIGAEVRYEGFVKQFARKSLEDPILPRRDINNISGATLSVRAMSRGVRKALAFLQLVYVNGVMGSESK